MSHDFGAVDIGEEESKSLIAIGDHTNPNDVTIAQDGTMLYTPNGLMVLNTEKMLLKSE